MGKQIVHVSVDAYTDANVPDGNRNTTAMWAGGPQNRCRAWIFFDTAAPRRAVVTRATLHLRQAQPVTGVEPGTIEPLRLYRVAKTWSQDRITHATAPGYEPEQVLSLYRDITNDGNVWSFDVTALVQSVVNGTTTGRPWAGVMITANTAKPVLLWSSQAPNPEDRPYLEVEWSDAPLKPTGARPAGEPAVSSPTPVFSVDFDDVAGDLRCQAVQFRLYESWTRADGNYLPIHDSGTIATPDPEYDAAAHGMPPLEDGVTRWWRIRTQDGAGLWSPWSDPEQVTYRPLGVATITYPAHSQVLSDPTPVVRWQTDFEQRAAVVWVHDAHGRVLWESAWLGSTQQVEVPRGTIIDENAPYRIRVRVWDQTERQANVGNDNTSNDEVWVTMAAEGMQAPPDDLTATVAGPYVDLAWTRAEIPDGFGVWRQEKRSDGRWLPYRLIDSGPIDKYGSHDDGYRFRDFPPPRRTIRYAVRPLDDGVQGHFALVETGTQPGGVWVIDDDTREVVLHLVAERLGGVEWPESTEAVEIVGASDAMVIARHQPGMRGTVGGVLRTHDAEGVTHLSAEQQIEALGLLSETRGKKWRVVFSRWSILAHVWGGSPVPADAHRGGREDLLDLRYDVELHIAQTGFRGAF